MTGLALSASKAERARGLRILAFCVLYVGVQLALIGRGFSAPSKHFGFWMFSESTVFVARLGRVVSDGQEVPAPRGEWIAPRSTGELVRYDWKTFVTSYRLDMLETPTQSKGTLADTLRYFQAALDYVAVRIPEDRETVQLVMRIQYRTAGGATELAVLRSRPRAGGPPRAAN